MPNRNTLQTCYYVLKAFFLFTHIRFCFMEILKITTRGKRETKLQKFKLWLFSFYSVVVFVIFIFFFLKFCPKPMLMPFNSQYTKRTPIKLSK